MIPKIILELMMLMKSLNYLSTGYRLDSSKLICCNVTLAPLQKLPILLLFCLNLGFSCQGNVYFEVIQFKIVSAWVSNNFAEVRESDSQ